METVKTEYAPATLETLEKTAFSAAYVAIRKAYHGTPRKVKIDGETVNHDGNSGGTEMIRRLYYGFSSSLAAAKLRMDAAAAAYEATPTKTTKADYDAAARTYSETTPNDTDDCIQKAALSLWENIADNGGETATETAFMDAVRAVHQHIYEQDKNTSTKVRRKYDDKGQLLAINDYQYIKYPHIYIDEYTGTDENGNATFDIVDVNDELAKYIAGQMANDTINEVLAILTATQKRIVSYMARGYTYETMAARLNISNGMVRKHVQRIREKARTIER